MSQTITHFVGNQQYFLFFSRWIAKQFDLVPEFEQFQRGLYNPASVLHQAARNLVTSSRYVLKIQWKCAQLQLKLLFSYGKKEAASLIKELQQQTEPTAL